MIFICMLQRKKEKRGRGKFFTDSAEFLQFGDFLIPLFFLFFFNSKISEFPDFP